MDKDYLKYVRSELRSGKKKGIGNILRILKLNNRQSVPVISYDREENMPQMEWTDRNVIVGVLRNKEQLSVCMEEKFYHIPAKLVSKRQLPLEYVAIYQSKNLFGNDAGIRYIGKIVDSAMVKRSAIKQIPRKSNEYYYVFKVNQWQKLDTPIQAKEVGFVRLFTNYEMLLASREVPELMLSNKTEHQLYNCIRKAVEEAQNDNENKTAVFAWDDCGFAVDVDDVQLIRNGQLINMYSVYDFLDMPLTLLGQIRRDMARDL